MTKTTFSNLFQQKNVQKQQDCYIIIVQVSCPIFIFSKNPHLRHLPFPTRLRRPVGKASCRSQVRIIAHHFNARPRLDVVALSGRQSKVSAFDVVAMLLLRFAPMLFIQDPRPCQAFYFRVRMVDFYLFPCFKDIIFP